MWRSNTKSTAAAGCSGDSFAAAAIISSTPKLFDLSPRTKLRITGADRTRYLNGQITNDIRKASGERAIYAAVLNAKGRMEADAFIHQSGDSFLIDADAALRESLSARLERYVIADDVQIEDLTDEFALIHLVDSETGGIAAERFGRSGIDLWITPAERQPFLRESSESCEIYDEERAETFRIERGVPRWGFELSNDIIPVEANLESRAIDYSKGCYIGQEIISRMKMSGQRAKKLVGLTSAAPLQPRAQLFQPTAAAAQKEVGWVTSVTHSETLRRNIALAFVKRGSNEPGTRLIADGCAVEVVELPFI